MTYFAESLAIFRRFMPSLDGLRIRFLQIAGLKIISPLLSTALLLAGKSLIDDVLVGGAFDLLPVLIALYFGIAVAKLVCSYCSSRLDAGMTTAISQKVRLVLYRHMLSLSPGSLKHINNGDILTRFSSDIEYIEYFIYSGPVGLFTNVYRAILFFVVLVALNWQLTVCALLIAPVLALVSIKTAPRGRRMARVARRKEAAWRSLAQERLNSVASIQVNAAEEFEAAMFDRRCRESRRAGLQQVAVQALYSALFEVVAILGGLIVILVGAFEIQNGNLTIGTMVAFLGSVGSLSGPIGSLAKTAGRAQRAAVRVHRVIELLDAKSAVVEKPGAPALVFGKGRLEFDNVTFGYARSQPILDRISFRIEPGETVAVVGPSGGGKSSLAKLAVRLYDPWQGAVKIDGQDLRDVSLNSVRRAVSLVMQEPHLFAGSIAANMLYASVAEKSAIEEIAEISKVADFAERLRGHYDSPVGPAGAWLSGGQRQRIAIARALLRESPILIFDEATAAVDSETEDHIQSAIQAYVGRRTMLIVSHRLSSLRAADRIIFVEGGQIVETGQPDALLASKSRFRTLFASQLDMQTAAA